LQKAFSVRVVTPMLTLVCLFTMTSAVRGAEAASSQDTFIQALFGDLPASEGVDANQDGALTVADVLLLDRLLFAGTVADLAPHTKGDQLVYRVTDPLGNVTTETTTVTSSDPGGAFVLDDLRVNGQQVIVHQTYFYIDMVSQLVATGGTDVTVPAIATVTTCAPALLQLLVPVIAGQMYSTTSHCDVKFTSNGVEVGTIDRTDSFAPQEVVDSLSVAAGTFDSVVHISGTTNSGGSLEADEIYLAPGVGAILRLQVFSGQTYRHELVSGTIGGQPVGQ